MTKKKVLITGASGCVGQYTSNWLIENSDVDLYLLLRDPLKLKSINKSDPRVNLLVGDLREAAKFTKDLFNITHVIHTATAWGDPQRANQVNIIAVKELFSLLNPLVLERIIYFSTASVLNKNLDPLPEAKYFGTEYIQTKAICLEELEKHPLSEKIVAVFPTLVFGGKYNGNGLFPTSYLTEGLGEATKWLWLARWFKAYSRFHFIHAADIAFICGKIITSTNIPKFHKEQSGIEKLVLGQPAISIDQAIEILLKWRGMRKTPSFPLWGWLIQALIKFLPIKINKWDLFSIKQRHFVHDPVTSPETIGGTSHAKTLNEILLDSELPRGKKSLNQVI